MPDRVIRGEEWQQLLSAEQYEVTSKEENRITIHGRLKTSYLPQLWHAQMAKLVAMAHWTVLKSS